MTPPIDRAEVERRMRPAIVAHVSNAERLHLATSIALALLVEEVTERSCWHWPGNKTDRGYARISLNGKMRRLARVVFVAAKGPIPEGREIDHLCRERDCINPAHLEAVTQIENNRRSMSPTGVNYRKEQCKAGHPFTAQNTIQRPFGRGCRECKNARRREARKLRAPQKESR